MGVFLKVSRQRKYFGVISAAIFKKPNVIFLKMSLKKIFANLNESIKKKSLFSSDESDSEENVGQVGDGDLKKQKLRKRKISVSEDSKDTPGPSKKLVKNPLYQPRQSSGSDTEEGDAPVRRSKRLKKKHQQQPPDVDDSAADSDGGSSRGGSQRNVAIQHSQGDSLFEHKTPIFENANVEIYVIKEAFKKQKIFNIEDHLYTVKIKLKAGQPPLLSSLLEGLEKALEDMIKRMQLFYRNGKDLLFQILLDKRILKLLKKIFSKHKKLEIFKAN